MTDPCPARPQPWRAVWTTSDGPPVVIPARIQRQRRLGWRMPDDAVYVGRPTMWGNPFDWRAAADAGYGDGRGAAVDAFRGWLARNDDWGLPAGETRESMAAKRQAILNALPRLRGRSLACWCPLDRPCHADVLLEMANE